MVLRTGTPSDHRGAVFRGSEGGGAVRLQGLLLQRQIRLIDVHAGRFEEHKRNLYDLNWNLLEDVTFKYKQFEGVEKPRVLPELLDYAERLSAPFHHARVDFYIVEDKIYFGEITFTNGAGFSRISPRSFGEEMGSWLELGEKGR